MRRIHSPGRHLQVTRCEAGFHVRDLNSTNGTFLDGVRLIEAEIPLNTVLRVGETELVFEPGSQGQQEPSFHGIVGSDPAVRQLVGLIQRVAPTTTVVSILSTAAALARAPRAGLTEREEGHRCGPGACVRHGPGWPKASDRASDAGAAPPGSD